MKKRPIKNYARLIVRTGASVEKGDAVVITAHTEAADFIDLLAEECYLAGAARVEVEWQNDALSRLASRFEEIRDLAVVRGWEEEKLKEREKNPPVRIRILSADPDGMRGADRDKLTRASMAKNAILKPYEDRIRNRYKWCVAAVPSAGWAKKVFPGEHRSTAVEHLWELILRTSRADGKDPMSDWVLHNRALHEKCDKINALDLTALEYESANGTKFRIGLIDGAKFIAGRKRTADGKSFNPNIPTEECFTTPRRGDAEGTVVAVKPLAYGGELIENFYLTFSGGKVTGYGAERNGELLGKILSMDEGASYLGECALVPYDSPVNQTGVLFYNTLFDENACCHLALGNGYTNTIAGFETMDRAAFAAMGVNDSSVHVDFMIGAPDLRITGVCRDGKRVPVFENGGWSEILK